MCEKVNPVKELKIYGIASDPVHIGTGGYTIGRVDNTIVRDPATNLPKIPGSSLAGVWRYYITLEIHKFFKSDDIRINRKERNDKGVDKIFVNTAPQWIKEFEGNKYAAIKCAGQDEMPTLTLEESKNENTGHCGHCIVCKGFGFSKKDVSFQGMIYFGDLHILFFPVFTREGTKWITTEEILRDAGLYDKSDRHSGNGEKERYKYVLLGEIKKEGEEGYINLGWMYLPYEVYKRNINLSQMCFSADGTDSGTFQLKPENIIIVPEELFAHIVNSNLEVRTSVAIDPVTGAAKPGALFTSEAIPRGTIFYGDIRIFDKSIFEGIDKNAGKLPAVDDLISALLDSKHYFETLGIGGMTTRGFGRMILKVGGEEDAQRRELCGKHGEAGNA